MIIIVLFLIVVAAVAGWWLLRHGLMVKPWLEQGVLGPAVGPASPVAKIGLGVFLAVVACLFTLFVSAYAMRMQASDWRPLPVPMQLWLNTGLLVLSSLALQWARVA